MSQPGHVSVVNPQIVPADGEYSKLLAEKEELQKQLEREQFHEKITFRQLKELNELVASQDKKLEQLKRKERGIHLTPLVLISILVGAMVLGGLISYWITTSDSGNQNIQSPVVNDTNLPDTTRAIRNAPSRPTNKKEEQVPARRRPVEIKTPVSKANPSATDDLAQSTTENTETKGQYKVRSKAYFHDRPDDDSRREAFIIHWNKAVLQALNDQNGFIFVVFTNHLGQTSRGWLAKKDLIKLN